MESKKVSTKCLRPRSEKKTNSFSFLRSKLYVTAAIRLKFPTLSAISLCSPRPQYFHKFSLYTLNPVPCVASVFVAFGPAFIVAFVRCSTQSTSHHLFILVLERSRTPPFRAAHPRNSAHPLLHLRCESPDDARNIPDR